MRIWLSTRLFTTNKVRNFPDYLYPYVTILCMNIYAFSFKIVVGCVTNCYIISDIICHKFFKSYILPLAKVRWEKIGSDFIFYPERKFRIVCCSKYFEFSRHYYLLNFLDIHMIKEQEFPKKYLSFACRLFCMYIVSTFLCLQYKNMKIQEI